MSKRLAILYAINIHKERHTSLNYAHIQKGSHYYAHIQKGILDINNLVLDINNLVLDIKNYVVDIKN